MKKIVLYLSVFLALALVLYGCKPQQNTDTTENSETVYETEDMEEIDLFPEDPSADTPDNVFTDPPTEDPTDPPTAPPTDPSANTPVNSPTEPPTDPPTSSPPVSPTEEEKEEATSQEGIQLPVIPG